MASYNPPTETLAIFDPSVFAIADIPLTQAQADARYLRFPTAQGTENLSAINVNGVATFNSGVNFASTAPPTSSQTIPASNDSSTKVPTTAWVQSAITAGSSNTLTDVLIAGNNAGSQPINMNNQNISAVNTISFATTSQNTAYTGAPAGIYSSANITIDANGKISAISSSTSTTITGTIIAFAGASVPVGYVKCDATPLSTATYPALFNLIGYTYGGAGGTFYPPNLLNKFIQGSTTSAGGSTSGNFTISNSNIQSATITSTDLGSGSPYVAFNTSSGISDWSYYKGKASGDGSVNVWTPVTTSTGTRGGTNLVSAFNTTIGTATPTPLIGTVPSLLLMYIIKT